MRCSTGKSTYQLKRLQHGEEDHVTRVIPKEQKRRLLGQLRQLLADLVVDFGLVVEMGDGRLAVGELLGIGQRRPDVVLEGRDFGRGAREVEGLRGFGDTGVGLRFAGEEVLPVVCYAEDGLDALERGVRWGCW
jgi:hypothetical protein